MFNKISFRRVTSSGNYIPEVDGLRFVAIMSVFIYHFTQLVVEKNRFTYHDSKESYRAFYQLSGHGNRGVELFFMISGFILAMPFAKQYLLGGKRIAIKEYFFRRITRIEPPYIVSLVICFIAKVYIARSETFSQLIPHFFASVFYIHNFIYGRNSLPLVNGVAWSLEIEVQFYLLAPFLFRMFSLPQVWRRTLMVVTAVLFSVIFPHLIILPFKSILDFIPYFILGCLLADFYISETKVNMSGIFQLIIFFILFCSIWLLPNNLVGFGNNEQLKDLLLPWILFLFFYMVLFSTKLKILMSKGFIPVVGGMCYSIYLMHLRVFSMTGKMVFSHKLTNYFALDSLLQLVLMILFNVLICGAFFLAIEQPCMNKFWYINLKNKLLGKSSANN